MAESKLCRLLSGSLGCNRDTLDQLLRGVHQRDAKARIVAAYFKDHASPAAIAFLHPAIALLHSNGHEDSAKAEADRLNPKGRAALNALLQSPHIETLNDVLIALARGFDLV